MQRLGAWIAELATAAPGWKFHAALVPVGIAVLYAYSVPGSAFLVLLIVFWLILGALAVWLVRLVAFFVGRMRGRSAGSSKWFVLAPVGALILGLLLWADVPLRARWELSRGDFEKAARAVQRGEFHGDLSDSRRLGLFTVTDIQPVRTGVLFYEATGDFLDDAGFAYLPQGPSADLENGGFEAPQFRSLGGGWYAWTASW